jgi:CRISPR type III-B/RAMP module RAMP protein Cmr6
MNLDLDGVSANSAVALDLIPWLKPLERCEQFGRKNAPWHLWLDKWSYPWAIRCDRAKEHWDEQAKRTGDRNQRRALRDTADGIPSGKTAALAVSVALAGDGRLAEHCRRTRALLDTLKRQHGECFGEVTLTLESRLLLHLGRANVLENVGLCCDRTTGLPLVPGTALKGVISAWACWAEHYNPADKSFRNFTDQSKQRRNFTATEAALAQRILGDDSASGSEHAGEVIFLGGFPTTPPRLGLDIVNPHHDANGRDVDPKPNTFLCVEPGTLWQFAFFVRPGVLDAAALHAQTKTWIEEALTQMGIGAKTAAGYGRFRQPNDADRAAERQAEVQAAQEQAAAAKRTEVEAEQARQQVLAQTAMMSDYPNPATFKNRVLDKLTPGQLEQLRSEIPLLQKPENESRREELKRLLATRDYKDLRKRLRDKDWFPKDWLPPQ